MYNFSLWIIMIPIKLPFIWDPYCNFVITLCCVTLSHCREIIYYCVTTVDFVLYLGPSRIDFWTKMIRNATKWTNIDTIWVSKKAGFFSAWLTYNIQFFIVRHNYPNQIAEYLRPILWLYYNIVLCDTF